MPGQDWESRLTGRTFEELVEEDVPEVVAESEDGIEIFELSEALLGSLSAASSPEVRELAQWWVDEKAANGTRIEFPIALRILEELVGLIRQERAPEENVYCWTS